MTKRKKILFIVSRLPINTEAGDRLRVYHFIKKLSEAGHQIDVIGFVPPGNYQVRTDIKAITHQCIAVEREGIEFQEPDRIKQLRIFTRSFFNGFPYRVWQWHDPEFSNQVRELIKFHNYDAVHLSEIAMGFVFHDLLATSEKPPLVYDLIDSVSLSLKNALEHDFSWLWPVRFIEYLRLKKFEKYVVRKADQAILISDRDKNFLDYEGISVIPNGIEENDLREQRRDIDLLFVGNMAAEPNADAARWFAREVMPRLIKQNSDIKFYIVGANASEAIRNLETDNVIVTGFVQNIHEYYRRAKIFVCPMRIGAGQKNKILEAMINKTPVISTTEGNIGVDAPASSIIAIADDASQFSNKILALLQDDDDRTRLAQNGYEYARSTFSWQKSCQLLEQCYED